MHICIVAEGYPFAGIPSFPFVEQICIALANQGIQISVIAPQSLTQAIIRHLPIAPKQSIQKTSKGESITIYRPKMFTVGNLKGPFKHHNANSYRNAVCKVLTSMPVKPDVCYGHFWHSGFAIYPAAKQYNIPLFVATGESEIILHKKHNAEELAQFINYVKGVICVSTKNQQESIEASLTSIDKCIVLPNAIDESLFYKKEKSQLRKKFGYKQEDFIIAYVGAFVYRKGAERLAQAILSLKDPCIKTLFIGNMGEITTDCPGILFKGGVPHEQIADYLNCADIFVLPTLHEGCCNANIEAMACGLPIISSDLSFNYDTMDKSFSILIDPLNISQIANAIAQLKQDTKKREMMSVSAVESAKQYTISQRALKIINFINAKL